MPNNREYILSYGYHLRPHISYYAISLKVLAASVGAMGALSERDTSSSDEVSKSECHLSISRSITLVPYRASRSRLLEETRT